MDQNSNSGGRNRCSYDDHLDFASYWADQTVEHEILRGHHMREAKPHAFPKRECDVINIDYIKPPCSMKNGSYRRKRTRASSSNFSHCRECSSAPLNRQHKYRKQKKKKSPCGMRIAELAVPTKRQCIASWRDNYDKLPAHMVERLRQHVLDQRPVVEIADAIHCFRRRKSVKKEKGERTIIEKLFGRPRKPLRANEVKALSAIFGYKIAKKLNIPLVIKLNDDLQKIGNVVSIDISNIMHKSKKVDMRNKTNKAMLSDVTKKVTIWISDVLEESSYKILEEQYLEFEEEVGPVLDLIDELIDYVVNICEPEPELVEESSSSESEDSNKEGLEEEAKDQENIEDHLQNELITIIDNIFKDEDIDMKSDNDEMQKNQEKNIEEEYLKSELDVYMDVENYADVQPSEFADANDDFRDALETNDDVNEALDEQNETASEEEAIAEEDGKKVKFNDDEEDTNALAGERTEVVEGDTSEKQDIDFASPNEDLLSDADESWPEEIQPPMLRPSESAIKSITSLGKILEDEEKDVPPEDDEKEQEGEPPASNVDDAFASDTVVAPEEETKPKEKETESERSVIDSKKNESLSKSRKSSKEKTSAPPERKSLTSKSKFSKPIPKKGKPLTKPKPEKIKTVPIKTIPKISKNLSKRKQDKNIDETAGTSKSVKDLSEHDAIESAKDIKFSSLRVKPKPNYRVNVNKAPSWVTRTYGEPSCICIDVEPKLETSHKINYNKDISKWCLELKNGYENLKLWNEWIDTTSRAINRLQHEIGRLAYPEKCSNKHVCKLLELKTNIDKDACLWRKLKKSTQERLRSYRKIYQIQKVRDCNRTLPY